MTSREGPPCTTAEYAELAAAHRRNGGQTPTPAERAADQSPDQSPDPPADPPERQLHRRYLPILRLTANGHTDPEIAAILGVPTERIRGRQRSIRRFYGTRTRAATITEAYRDGTLPPPEHVVDGCAHCRVPGAGTYRIQHPRDLVSRMRAVRQTRDQTQETFGAQHGFSKRQVAGWETRINEPDLTMAVHIAHAIGYDLALIPRETP